MFASCLVVFSTYHKKKLRSTAAIPYCKKKKVTVYNDKFIKHLNIIVISMQKTKQTKTAMKTLVLLSERDLDFIQ